MKNDKKKQKRRYLNCFVKFFSQLDLVLQSEEGGDLSGFMPNGENSEDNDDDGVPMVMVKCCM